MKAKFIKNEKVLLKIIPHHSVLNSQNRRLWHTLHDLLSIYNSPLTRLFRDGLNFTYRAKDDIWWVVKIASMSEKEDAKPQIELYICLTKQFADVFLIKLKNHEQWKKCTIQEVPLDTIKLPENLDLYQLKYERADMFSLACDYTKQTSPIRDLMQVSKEIKPGDFAGLYVRMEALNRRKWKNLSDYAWSTWSKGGIPQRANFDVSRIIRTIWRITATIVLDLKRLIDDMLDAIRKSFSNYPTTETRKSKLTLPDVERQELMVNGELSYPTRNKRNLPTFKTNMYLVVKSDKQERKDMLANSMASAFNDLNGNNKLKPVKINIRYIDKLSKLENPRNDFEPNIMSVDEIGKIVQLPTADLQEEYKEELEANKNIETEIPKVFLDPKGIYMGASEYRGEKSDIYLPATDLDMLMTSRAFIGSPRMGKDQAVINLIVEAKRKHGIGAVIPDVIDERNGHRGMADALRDHLPPEDVIDINLGDYDWPVYIGLSSIVSKIKNERIAGSRIATELTSFFMGDDIENNQTREYLREAAKTVKGDLMGMKLLFMSQAYRKEKIEELKAKGRDVSIWEDFNNMGEGKRGQIYGPIMVRLGEIMGDEFLRPIFCQKPNPAMDLERWMNDGKVVIFRVPSRDLGEMAVKTLTHWIILTTFLTKLSMGGAGVPTWLVLNEPHQFLSKGLIHFCQRLLAEGPKYKIAPVFLFHNFKQLPNDFVEILLSSSLNWHIFKNTNDNVYNRLAHYLFPTFTPELAMSSTKRFYYIACWLDPNGEYQTPFMMKAPDLVGNRYRTIDNSFLTKRHSRLYGRNIVEVERELQERNKLIFKTVNQGQQ